MADVLLGVSFEDVDNAAFSDLYTAPAGTTSNVISLVLSNKLAPANNITATVQVTRVGGTPVSVFVKDINIPVGDSLEVVPVKPIVLNEGDILQAQMSDASASDATMSILNQS